MGLSFLDVLCCGLGAAILLLLIVKHEGPILSSEQIDLMAGPKVQRLEKQLQSLAADRQALDMRLASLDARKAVLMSQEVSHQKGLNELESTFSKLRIDLAGETARLNQLNAFEEELDKRIVEESSGRREVVVEKFGALDGIRMGGSDRVVILLDVSASMLHWNLVEIIRLQVGLDANLSAASKWNQSILAAQFAYETIDKDARFKLLRFSESVFDLNDDSLDGKEKLFWDNKSGLHDGLVERLSQQKPRKGTNLYKALDAVRKLIPKPTRILIITDGLPSKIDGRSRLKGCSRSKSAVSRVSSECRLSVGIKSVEVLTGKLAKVPIDVILLPLDGDSEGIRFYSLITGISAGKLLTPSVDWLLK